LFGFSPDGGDGSAEFLLLAAAAVAVLGGGVWLRRWMRNRSSSRAREVRERHRAAKN
jgi:hypothetical protein